MKIYVPERGGLSYAVRIVHIAVDFLIVPYKGLNGGGGGASTVRTVS